MLSVPDWLHLLPARRRLLLEEREGSSFPLSPSISLCEVLHLAKGRRGRRERGGEGDGLIWALDAIRADGQTALSLRLLSVRGRMEECARWERDTIARLLVPH